MTAEQLTGAYVLDAVSDVERAGVERHLGECASCRQEVAELRVAAAQLGSAVAVEPPPELRLMVLVEVARTRQLPPRMPGPRGVSRAKTWRLRVALFGAAASAVVAVALGLHTSETPPSVDSVLSAPDASTIPGTGATLVVSRNRNQAVLLTSGLPALDAERVYQVWLIGTGGAHSAGLLPADPAGRMLLADLPPGTDRIGITVEPAGGSPGPTTPAVSMFPLS